MKCPNCSLVNPPSAMWCDCGYEFVQGSKKKMGATAIPEEGSNPRSEPSDGSKSAIFAILIFLFAAVVMFFMVSGKSGKTEPSEGSSSSIVQNSAWDGSVYQVKQWMKDNLNDPASLQVIEWGKVAHKPDGGYLVRCKYRAKNAFGGFVINHKAFHLTESGEVEKVVDWLG